MFSVVIPVFNKRATVRAAVQSVLRQTFPASELILVDDGSTDGSLEAICGIDDPRLRIVTQENAGEGAARNAGIGASRHPWVAFLDADDLWFEDHLAELAAVREHCPAARLIGARDLLAKGERELAMSPRSGGGDIGYMDYFAQVGAGAPPFGSSSAAVHKEAWEQAGGFGPSRLGADSAFWTRVALRNRVAASTRVTALYVQRADGVSRSAGSRWLGTPPRELSDLAPAVAAVLREGDEVAPALRASIDLFIRRYAYWCIHTSARVGDTATLRAVRRLMPAGWPLRERLILAAALVPGAPARAACGLLARLPVPKLRR